MADTGHDVFITGATGFLGGRLAAELIRRGHRVRGLVRRGSDSRLAQGCEPVPGDALDASTYQSAIAPSDTFVHLVGVAHPSPKKAAAFRSIDLKSIQEAARAAKQAGVRHFVYLSVAQPAPMMLEYQAVRAEGERLVRETGMAATFVRPWYVLGPGRRWPLMLTPFYAIARVIPSTRESALRLGLVTIEQMTRTLAWAVENPPVDVRVLDTAKIRAGGESEGPAHRLAVSA